MRLHNSVILVTEPVSIEQISIGTDSTALPNLPSGDLGREVKQVTIRCKDVEWEWQLEGLGDWFWMAAGEILVIPVRDRLFLEGFRIRAASTVGDFRIVYEC